MGKSRTACFGKRSRTNTIFLSLHNQEKKKINYETKQVGKKKPSWSFERSIVNQFYKCHFMVMYRICLYLDNNIQWPCMAEQYTQMSH